MASQQDPAWKEILERYFEEFLRFFFPEIHRDIDWSLGFDFLDMEFEQVLRGAGVGKQVVDRLVKVHLLDGPESWLLIHIEVQGRREARFQERMFLSVPPPPPGPGHPPCEGPGPVRGDPRGVARDRPPLSRFPRPTGSRFLRRPSARPRSTGPGRRR